MKLSYAAIHRKHGHVSTTFATTQNARDFLLARQHKNWGRDHRWAVVDENKKEIREVTPHEITLITDRQYAKTHGDLFPTQETTE